MVKLTLSAGLYNLTQIQNAKLFIRHLLLGLSDNNTLTDLVLDLPSHCWDWPQGVLNVLLHCVKDIVVDNWLPHDYMAYLYAICVPIACSLLLTTV